MKNQFGRRCLFLQVICVAALALLAAACGKLPAQSKTTENPDLPSTSPIISSTPQSSLFIPVQSAVESSPSASARLTAAPSAAPTASPHPEKPDKAVVIFTFDDGDVSDYLLAYPILKQYGIKGTSYIVAGFLDKGIPEKLTWAQVKEMSQYGWDFGDHTYTHDRMKSLTDAQLKENMEKVNASFKKQGLQLPEVMAYPYGSYNNRVVDAIKPFRKQARLAFYETKFVDLKHIDPYRIPSVSADMKSDNGLKSIEKTVDKARDKKSVIVFRVHAMYKQKAFDTVCSHPGLRSGSGPQTSSELFSKLVKYCVEKGCAFMTMKELMELYSNQ